MPVVRRSHNDRVDVRARNQISKVVVAGAALESAGTAFGCVVLLNGLPSPAPKLTGGKQVFVSK